MSFKRLDPEDISISAESVVAPAWSGQQPTLTAFYTSSTQVGIGAGNYYYDIYQADPQTLNNGAAVQFSVAYGNRIGSGSTLVNSAVSSSSNSSVIYGQYRTLVNGDENTDFTFGNIKPNSIYVISVDRARYKEKLLPGSFNLTLKSGSAVIKLTDNSVTNTTVSYIDAGRVYDLVSGSNGSATYTALNANGFTPASGSYGKFLPDIGTIILNGEALKASVGTGGGLGMIIDEGFNSAATINLSSITSILNQGASFSLQSEETISSNYIFVRVRNGEFNYSTNPSIITGSGELRYDVLVNSPQAYMTTVGLYNDNNDLVGVAKLSRPLLKDFTKEALIRIKLDY
jgi:hypothetical protein